MSGLLKLTQSSVAEKVTLELVPVDEASKDSGGRKKSMFPSALTQRYSATRKKSMASKQSPSTPELEAWSFAIRHQATQVERDVSEVHQRAEKDLPRYLDKLVGTYEIRCYYFEVLECFKKV